MIFLINYANICAVRFIYAIAIFNLNDCNAEIIDYEIMAAAAAAALNDAHKLSFLWREKYIYRIHILGCVQRFL